jgi:hypothetical protein
VKHVSDAYLEQAALEPDKNEHILTGHRNFLSTAVYFLYSYNRKQAASEWYAYAKKQYPTFRDFKDATVEEYAFARIQEEVGSTDPNRIRAVLEGYIETHYIDLSVGEEDHSEAMLALAHKIHARYQEAVGPKSSVRVGLPPFKVTQEVVLKRLLSPDYGLDPNLRARLLTRLDLPQDYGRDILNVAPTGVSTNAPGNVSTNAAVLTNGPATVKR